MDNYAAMNKAFTVYELVVVMLMISVLMTVIIPNGIKTIERAKFQATVREMQSIAQASIDYYNASSQDSSLQTWPSQISDLAPAYMAHVPLKGPLGGSYQLSSADHMITVTTTIPRGISEDLIEGNILNVIHGPNQDEISISQYVSNEFIYHVKP